MNFGHASRGLFARFVTATTSVALLASCGLWPGAAQQPVGQALEAGTKATEVKRDMRPYMIRFTRSYKLLGVNDATPQDAVLAAAAPIEWWADGSVRKYHIAQFLDLGGVRVLPDYTSFRWYWDTDVVDDGGKVDWNGFASFFTVMNLPENAVNPSGELNWGYTEVKSYHFNVNGVTATYASAYPAFGNAMGSIGWKGFASSEHAGLFKPGVNNFNATADAYGDFSANDWLRWNTNYKSQPALCAWLNLTWDTPDPSTSSGGTGGTGSPAPSASPSDGSGSGSGGDPNGSPSPGSSGDPNGTPGPGSSGDPNGSPSPGSSGDPNGSPSPGTSSPSPSPSGSGTPGTGGDGTGGTGGDGSGGGTGGTGGSEGGTSPLPSTNPTTTPTSTPQPSPTPTHIPTPTPKPSKTPLSFDAEAAFPPLTERNTINVRAEGSWTLSVDYWGTIATGSGNTTIDWDGVVNRGTEDEFSLEDDQYTLRLRNDSLSEGVDAEVYIFGITISGGGGGKGDAAAAGAKYVWKLFIDGVKVISSKPGNAKKAADAAKISAVAAKLALATKSVLNGATLEKASSSTIFRKAGGYTQAQKEFTIFINRVGGGTWKPIGSPKGPAEMASFIDGTNVIVRSFSSGPTGGPTLEIQVSSVLKPLIKSISGTNVIKIRY